MLVDTSVLIDYTRGRTTDQIAKFEQLVAQRNVLIGDLILCEFLRGLEGVSPEAAARLRGLPSAVATLDVALARQAFERLDTPLAFEQRVRYAYAIGLNNIAEGIFNIAVKHGIDPRDYSLVAFGAAGPLLLPAIADLIHVRSVIVPPHPGLFSALGLLASEKYVDHRPKAFTAWFLVLEMAISAPVKTLSSGVHPKARPTMKPACGPPSSLSPLKVTTSAPAFSASIGVGSWGRP